MSLRLIDPPDGEPLDLDTVKLANRIDSGNAEDILLAMYIAAARRTAEQATGRKLIAQTWRLSLDAFPCGPVDLQLAPIASITSVTYLDAHGDRQTLAPAAYRLDTGTLPGWLHPAYGTTWPDSRSDLDAVQIDFVAGWNTAADVPQDIRLWMLAQVGHWYRNREATTESGLVPVPYVDNLLDPWRIWRAA